MADKLACPRCGNTDRLILGKKSARISCGACANSWSNTDDVKKGRSSERQRKMEEKLASWEKNMSSASDSWHGHGIQVDAKKQKRIDERSKFKPQDS